MKAVTKPTTKSACFCGASRPSLSLSGAQGEPKIFKRSELKVGRRADSHDEAVAGFAGFSRG
jgi:hypothetical protein